MFYDVKNLARLRRGRANPTSTKTHCCSRAREPGAMERSPRRSSRGAPPTAARGASLAGLPPAISVSPRSGQGRRESRFQARLVSLKDGRGLPSLYWFLDFKMGGERRSDGAQGGKRGMRRRVVGDAGPRLLLGNRLLSPRPPPRAFCPVNCRSGEVCSAGRHAGALQGEAGGLRTRRQLGGPAAGRVWGAGASVAFCAAPFRPAEPASHAPGGYLPLCSLPLCSHTLLNCSVEELVDVERFFWRAQRSGHGRRALPSGN